MTPPKKLKPTYKMNELNWFISLLVFIVKFSL